MMINKEKLFELSDLEIWREGDKFFAIYDAGAHQVIMRKDEITEEEAKFACEGSKDAVKILFRLQEQLTKDGVDPYISNYQPDNTQP